MSNFEPLETLEIEFLPVESVLQLIPLHRPWEKEKTKKLAKSMMKEGWKDRPLFYVSTPHFERLATGTHRQAALQFLYDTAYEQDEVMWNGEMIGEYDLEQIEIPMIDLREYLDDEEIEEFFDISDESDRLYLAAELLPDEVYEIYAQDQRN